MNAYGTKVIVIPCLKRQAQNGIVIPDTAALPAQFGLVLVDGLEVQTRDLEGRVVQYANDMVIADVQDKHGLVTFHAIDADAIVASMSYEEALDTFGTTWRRYDRETYKKLPSEVRLLIGKELEARMALCTDELIEHLRQIDETEYAAACQGVEPSLQE